MTVADIQMGFTSMHITDWFPRSTGVLLAMQQEMNSNEKTAQKPLGSQKCTIIIFSKEMTTRCRFGVRYSTCAKRRKSKDQTDSGSISHLSDFPAVITKELETD